MRMPIAAALPALALVACAPTAAETAASAERAAVTEDKLVTALAGLVPGQTQSCLPQTGTPRYQTEGFGKTILYRYGRDLIYRTDTSGGCEQIANGDALVTRQVGSQLCAGDIATTYNQVSRFQTGSCSFGPFTAYRRP